MGKQCTIVMQEDVTLERAFGAAAGAASRRVLEEHGVEVHGGDELARFEGAGERVRAVVCEQRAASSRPTRSCSAPARCPT